MQEQMTHLMAQFIPTEQQTLAQIVSQAHKDLTPGDRGGLIRQQIHYFPGRMESLQAKDFSDRPN